MRIPPCAFSCGQAKCTLDSALRIQAWAAEYACGLRPARSGAAGCEGQSPSAAQSMHPPDLGRHTALGKHNCVLWEDLEAVLRCLLWRDKLKRILTITIAEALKASGTDERDAR